MPTLSAIQHSLQQTSPELQAAYQRLTTTESLVQKITLNVFTSRLLAAAFSVAARVSNVILAHDPVDGITILDYVAASCDVPSLEQAIRNCLLVEAEKFSGFWSIRMLKSLLQITHHEAYTLSHYQPDQWQKTLLVLVLAQITRHLQTHPELEPATAS